ncbi:hypothetical protein Sru01_50900 [Sphaerisporangium rufum]|uniref:DNA ligase D 3'-phosphoesterase domain-containing protein n=1 Tax=Sphaerisporangium rufum TaxID=1381558 RepID=A0A919R6M9_9ACTN|nr:DNA polymerase ligase N-terminal domain-containing protein [Sphaerisporangium rufum]GII80108.1 hypothetical protein Sru01_50900 [Sphaerisporangium rufum]
MSADKLDTYRRKRDPARTPEPVPAAGPLPSGGNDTFVIQEHHARRLHWDLRLERDGVLVSWAIPKGLPLDPKTNHLAVHTEDHPLEYATFEGEIAPGEYGGGLMLIWDRGTYQTEKWTDREVKVVMNGSRATGRYVLFPLDAKNWMIHRMDPPPPPRWPPVAEVRPMRPAERRRIPRDPGAYGFEFDFGGRRALAEVRDGRAWFYAEDGTEIPAGEHPGLESPGRGLPDLPILFDGQLTGVGDTLAYMVFDVLRLNTGDLTGRTYQDRRRTLDHLKLRGPHWQTTPWFPGDGEAMLAVARERGLPAVFARRLDGTYRPGGSTPDWLRIPVPDAD